MQITRIVLLGATLASAGFAVDKEIIALQRDMALLQVQVDTMQKSVAADLKELTKLVQQAIEAANRSNTSVTGMEAGLRERLTAPVANVSSKMDQMSTDFSALRESIADMNERLGKVQIQVVDLTNTVKVLQAPAPPPPTAAAPGGAPPQAGAPAGPPQGMSARQLYDSAQADKSRGNLDLAMQGFQEYLKWFPTTDLAPNAQFAIGEIHFSQNQYPEAITAFDTVLERWADNNKTADAMYMKGMALLRSNQRNQAAQEFLAVVQKYPNAEVAQKARAQRKALGLSSPSGAAPAPARRRR